MEMLHGQEMEALARCTRCAKMYDEASPGPCRYHPGTYGNRSNPLTRTWSCCGAHEDAALGCATGAHLRCEQTAAALQSFGSAGGGVEERTGLRRRGVGREPPPEPAPRNTPPEGLQTYTCVVGDTLASVALKHRMKAVDLRRWNKLLSPSLFAGQRLLVSEPPPRSPAEVRAEAVRTVMRRGGVPQAEAGYYVDEFGDAPAALRALAEDAAGVAEGELRRA